MNKTMTALSVAALLSASSFAMAQDAAVGVDANAGVGVETPAVDATVNAGTDASASTDAMASTDNSYDSLTAALSGSASVDLATVTEESQVTIVLLSSLEGETTAFDEAFAADAAGATTLHTNVSGNTAISAKLEAQGYTADDVVAVKSNADGSVTVYVDDRA